MENTHKIQITTHDRLLRAWENSMELVRDYESYSKMIDDDEVKKVFKKFAEDEGEHASTLHNMIVKNQGMKQH